VQVVGVEMETLAPDTTAVREDHSANHTLVNHEAKFEVDLADAQGPILFLEFAPGCDTLRWTTGGVFRRPIKSFPIGSGGTFRSVAGEPGVGKVSRRGRRDRNEELRHGVAYLSHDGILAVLVRGGLADTWKLSHREHQLAV
jgi:hypothetical protein